MEVATCSSISNGELLGRIAALSQTLDNTMRSLTASLKSGWTWWWGFGLFIAAPALLLALLGLRAVRAERIEREQQAREQQTQLARLADAALAGAWSAMEQALLPATVPPALRAPDFGFTFAAPDRVVFPADKVWIGETTAAPARAVTWSFATQQLIEQAQAAEAQGRWQTAAGLYRRLSSVEPKLRGWAAFCLARDDRYVSGLDWDAGGLARRWMPG